MHKVALVLACLASASHGEPLDASKEKLQGSTLKQENAKDTIDSMKALAVLLLSSDDSAAFNPAFANSHPAVLQSGNRLSVASPQMKGIPVYDLDGKPTGQEEDLSIKIARAGPYVVHRQLVAEFANKRVVKPHVKTRSEVRGGGKKPYDQKGSGRARRGSSRSPLIVGGGKSFGPRNTKNYKKKVNRKEAKLAISTALMGAIPRMKAIPNDFVKKFDVPKTKAMRLYLEALGVAKPNEEKTLIITKNAHLNTYLSARNLGNKKTFCRAISTNKLTVRHILWATHIFVTPGALELMRKRYTTIGKTPRLGEELEAGWQDKKPEPVAA